MAVVLLLFAASSGCTGPQESAARLTSLELAGMLLEEADLPENFTFVEKEKVSEEEMPPEDLERGIRERYNLKFARVQGNSSQNTTVIDQYIFCCSTDKIEELVTKPLVSNEYATYEVLPDPGIGNSSVAYRVTTTYTGADGNSSEQEVSYMIKFCKLDIYEILYLHGEPAEYDLLRDAAVKAEVKIR